MRETVEEAAIIYRQEAENLLYVVAPAAVLGPVFVLVSAAGLTLTLVSIPILLSLYFVTYAACVRCASLVMRNQAPDPGRAYVELIPRVLDLGRASLPGGALLAAVWASAAYVSDQGVPLLALAIGALGAAAAFAWAARRAFDLPLMLVHGASARDAYSFGSRITAGPLIRPLTTVVTVALPVIAAGLFSLALSALLGPVFGAVVFAIAAALWLPFPALSLSLASDRLLDQVATSSPQTTIAQH